MTKAIAESDWWRAALAAKASGGQAPPIDANLPQPGYYSSRAYPRGPKLPARIWQDAAGAVFLKIADELKRNPNGHWPYLASHPITAAEYRDLCRAQGIVAELKAGTATLNDIPPPTFK